MALSLASLLSSSSSIGAALASGTSSSCAGTQSERWSSISSAPTPFRSQQATSQGRFPRQLAVSKHTLHRTESNGRHHIRPRTPRFDAASVPAQSKLPQPRAKRVGKRRVRMTAAGGSGRPQSPLDPVGPPPKQRSKEPEDPLSRAFGAIAGHPNGSLIGALASAAWNSVSKNVAETAELFADLPPSDLADTVAPEALADPDSKFVDVGKVRVHYKEYVKQGLSPAEVQRLPTILLLHGFAGSTWSYRKVMAELADALDGHRVIAFDRPPFGLTSRPLDVQPNAPDNPYTAEGTARLMLSLMDTLNIDKAVAMGHSAGAPIVIDAALLAPERITALGLLAPAVFVDKSALSRGGLYAQLRLLYTRALLNTPGIGLNYIRQMYRKRRAEVNKKALTYADADKVTDEDIEGYLKPMMAHDWDRASLLQFRSFGFEPVGDRIKDLGMPVLILQGDLDRAVPVHAARSLSALLTDVTDTTYVELEKCGHQPMEEFPEVFVEKVTEFLGSLSDKAGAQLDVRRTDVDLDVEVPIAGMDVTSVEAAPSAL